MNDTNKLIELMTRLVHGLIKYPADLKVTQAQATRRSLSIMFQAHADDTGKLIGDGGVMIAALREIARHMGNSLEPVTGKKEHGPGFKPNPDYKIDSEVKGLEAIGQFIFNDSAKVQYHADNGEKTTLVLLIDGSENDFEPELEEALDVVMRSTGLARGHKLAVEMDSL